MTTFIIVAIVLLVGVSIIKQYTSLVKIQDEATMLVAYLKHAGKGKSPIFDKDKTDEEFYKYKYEELMKVCYLFVRFSDLIRNKPPYYRFQIIENGPTFGVLINVKHKPFMDKVACTMTKIIDSMPSLYQSSLRNYMSQPYSPKNIQISNEIELRLFPKDKYLKELSYKLRNTIINQDYLYTLFNSDI